MSVEVKPQPVAAPALPAVKSEPAAEVVAKQAAAQKQVAEKSMAETAVNSAARQIDSYLKSTGRQLDIRVDDSTGRTVVTVRDSLTGDVIRQIPSEEALRLARSLGESAAALIDQTV